MGRLLAGLVALLLALCLATAAFAHASLIGTEPGDGSVVAQPPKTAQLRFSEPVAPALVKLIDANGRVRGLTVAAVDQSLVITLPDDLPRGTQVVSYRVVSQDGHPIGGSLVFSIGAVTGAATPSNDSLVSPLIWLARIGVYIGLFAGVGGVFFAIWIGRGPGGATAILAALYIGLVSAAASLGLQGLDLLGLPLSGIVTAAPWTSALSTSLGPSLLIAIAAMMVARFAWRGLPPTVARVLTGLAMAGVGLSLATSGHAATASPQWLTRPSLFLHGVGVAFWAGALMPLAAMAWQRNDGLPHALKGFSSAAVWVVGMLALAGLVLAIIQLESFRALIETRYGIILSVKLMLVAGLMALAALNKFRLTPAVVGDHGDTRPLLRSILAEGALVIGILAVVAGWRFTPPPRALAAAIEAPLAVHIHSDAAMFQVLISPGRAGTDDFVLQLMKGDASPLAAKEATLTLSLPERGIEPIERNGTLGPDGYWHLRDVPLPLPGRWHMRIDALVSDFQKVTLEDDFDVR
ncbi:copper resistance protein CopC [Bradyrhizobium sp. Ai1a-2]|uniref:copper resistance CopC/CopD family protein n=1 Tax=Bradyrhizobium sp. Ai1a-2 TaxID=196490 RepID=UPI0003F4C144|nr:copper resistance protein CopC [Bradyrhizobium sp. Ai1a-2]